MQNLNDPKLSFQQKQHLLEMQVNPDWKPANKCGWSFPSYWHVTVKDLQEINKKTIEEKYDSYLLDFNPSSLEGYYPEWSVLLFESDRLEKGEWDEFYKRYEKLGYQTCFACGVVGEFIAFEKDETFTFNKSNGGEIGIENYPDSLPLIEAGKQFISLGIIEVPFPVIEKYKEHRVYGRTSRFGDEAKRRFVEAVDDVQIQLDEYLKSRELKSRKGKNTKKNKKNRGFSND